MATSEELEKRKGDESSDWRWYTQFAGVSMAHNYFIYDIFSRISDNNPQIKRIIELGTYKGAMTIALGLEGVRKQIPVDTFDLDDKTTTDTRVILSRLDVTNHYADIFKNSDEVKALLVEPCFLVCDNGNKPNEFELFGKDLPVGSIIAVHDYGQEFFDKDALVLGDKVVPYMREDWEKHNAQFAIYKVVK